MSNGTLEGTHLVADLNSTGSSNPIGLTVVGNDLFFIADTGGSDGLFRVDTGGQLHQIEIGSLPRAEYEVNDVPPIGVELNGAAFFAGEDGQLWKLNPGETTATLVTAVYPGEAGVYAETFVKAGGSLFFTVYRSHFANIELWKSDGTADGTVLVAPGIEFPTEAYVDADGRLVFTDGLAVNLYVSDGTATGTHVIATNLPGLDLAHFPDLGLSNGRVFFTKDDGVHGEELFMIPASAPGDANDDGVVDYGDYTRWADHYLQPGDWGFAQGDFNRDGEVDGGDYTLWADNYVASPVEAAVALLIEGSHPRLRHRWRRQLLCQVGGIRTHAARHPGPPSSGLGRGRGWLFRSSGRRTFGPAGIELQGWCLMGFRSKARTRRLRGTDSRGSSLRFEPLEERRMLSAAPVLVKDINATTDNSQSYWFAELNGATYFPTDHELWRTDGSTAGTELITALEADRSDVVALHDRLYFIASDAEHGSELWSTDGTAEGTQLVADVRSGTGSSGISSLTVLGDLLLFSANDGTHGSELWASDGTTEGTYLVADIVPGSGSAKLRDFVAVGDTMYFTADTPELGRELWKTDGTSAELIKDIAVGPASAICRRLG